MSDEHKAAGSLFFAAAAAIAACTFVTGCAKEKVLVPAASAREVEGNGYGASTEVAGVTVEARSQVWRGVPDQLTEVLPLQITLENDSAHPLRIRYRDIQLQSDSGVAYPALPPFDIRGEQASTVTPTMLPSRFYVAPYAAQMYPYLSPWSGPFVFDSAYWDTYYPEMVDISLPTGDMIQKALPEGVLERGGRVTGFVYFRPLESDEERVTLTMSLVDVETEQQFGTVNIPFEVLPARDADRERIRDREGEMDMGAPSLMPEGAPMVP